MIISVVPGSGVELLDPWDFRRFHLAMPAGMDAEALAAVLGPLAHAAGSDAVWVSAGELRGLGPDDAAWRRGVDEMIAKAASHGWVDTATGAIRAHVERV